MKALDKGSATHVMYDSRILLCESQGALLSSESLWHRFFTAEIHPSE